MKTTKGDGDFRRVRMSAAVSDGEVASFYLVKTERMIAKQRDRTVEDVRPVVARSLKITASAADFIRRNRRKVVPSWLKENIVALFIETAQAELRAIENEILIARQIGLGNNDGALVAARARAAALVEILDGVSSEGAGASPP